MTICRSILTPVTDIHGVAKVICCRLTLLLLPPPPTYMCHTHCRINVIFGPSKADPAFLFDFQCQPPEQNRYCSVISVYSKKIASHHKKLPMIHRTKRAAKISILCAQFYPFCISHLIISVYRNVTPYHQSPFWFYWTASILNRNTYDNMISKNKINKTYHPRPRLEQVICNREALYAPLE